MKYLSFRIGICLVLWLSHAAAETEADKRLMDAVTIKVASQDAQGLAAVLPSFESVWDHDPAAYFTAVKKAMSVLKATPDAAARGVALQAFAKVMAKTGPSETKAATAYFQLKSAIVSHFCGMKEVQSDKARLLMIASYLGEIRSRIIPGYQNRDAAVPGWEILEKAGVSQAADLPTPAFKAAYDEAVKENEENRKMNELQLALFSANGVLIFSLTGNVQDVARGKKADNRAFLDEILTRAKFTAEERRKLLSDF